MKKPFQPDYDRQAGFASFSVAMVIMIVVSLIVLGFAANSRMEQRRAVDNQLSTEAYDAAESGINSAYALIKDGLSRSPAIQPQAQSQCNGATYQINASNNLDSGNTVSIACLLVNPNPSNLLFTAMPVGQAQVMPVESQGGGSISSITISWQQHNQSPPVAYAACPWPDSFPSESAWPAKCAAPVLQVDLAPAFGWTSTANLEANTRSIYLQPNNGGVATYNIGIAGANGSVVKTHCNTGHPTEPYDCTLKITGMPVLPGSAGAYYVRITPLYLTADVNVTAQKPGAGGNYDLTNAQVVIDATGRAQDVLKRIQERVCINDLCSNGSTSPASPLGALQVTNGICKRYEVAPGFYQQDASPSMSSCHTNPF